VNNRFIKNHYLNHAIRSAYDELITKEVFPSYFLFLDVDPANIDINVHPTKTEIKFEDERLIYNYLRVTLKHSLGQYSVSPMLDFNTDHNFASRHSHIASPDLEKVHYKSGQKSMYFPENEERFKPGNQKSTGWEDIYKGMQQFSIPENTDGKIEVETLESEAFRLTGNDEMGMKIKEQKEPYQIHNQYVLHQVKSGLMVIDYQAAHERILYERYLDYLKNGKSSTQKELFPRTVELDPAKGEVLKNILQKVNNLGFEMEDFGHHTFIIHGTPSGLDANTDLHQLIQQLIQNYIENIEFELGVEDNLARSMAISSGLKKGKRLEKEEMISLIDQLFGCEMPYKSPSGKKTYVIIEHDELFKRFSN
jgi:DNA mismatch repair protein MutL